MLNITFSCWNGPLFENIKISPRHKSSLKFNGRNFDTLKWTQISPCYVQLRCGFDTTLSLYLHSLSQIHRIFKAFSFWLFVFLTQTSNIVSLQIFWSIIVTKFDKKNGKNAVLQFNLIFRPQTYNFGNSGRAWKKWFTYSYSVGINNQTDELLFLGFEKSFKNSGQCN